MGFALVVGLVMLLAAGKAILFGNIDPDFFWHLRVAEQLQSDGIGPLVDRMSFASIKDPWTPYSWLAELLMKWTWDAGGLAGVLLSQAALQMALVLLVAMSCLESTRQHHGEPRYFASALCTAAGLLFAFPYLSYRPVLFALVLMSLATWLMFRDLRIGPTRAIWIVPVLVAVTINLHLYAVVTAGWLVALCLGKCLSRELDAKRYVAVAAASMAACCLTPMLPGVIGQMIAYQQADVMVRAGRIAEMQPFYTSTPGMMMLAIVVGLLWLLATRWKTLGAAKLLWLAASFVLLFRLGRFAPVFAMVAMPMLAALLPGLRDAVLGKPLIRAALAIVLLCGAVRLATAFPSGPDAMDAWLTRNGPEADAFPTAAARFVESRVPVRHGKILNEFTWGGYLAWRLGDRFQVLMDGRTQLYSESFWRSAYLGEPSKLQDLLGPIDADVAVVPKQSGRLRQALDAMGWRVSYEDEFAVVLVPEVNSSVEP